MTLRMSLRALVQTAVIILAAVWLTSLAALVVATFWPQDDPWLTMSYWSTGVFLLVLAPIIVVLGRRAFRRAPRLGPQVDDEDIEPEERPRHPGLSGEHEPRTRW